MHLQNINDSLITKQVKQAFKANLLPAVVLWLFALTIAFCYFNWHTANDVFEDIAAQKLQYGWRFAMVSTALFAGLLPFLFLVAMQKITQNIWKYCLFYLLFWAYKGIEVNTFYNFQSNIFGSELTPQTIIYKTLFDQFIFSPFWASPITALVYLWVQNNFCFKSWAKAIDSSLFKLTIPILVVSGWLVWIPAVSIIYSMPSGLQIPLFNIVMCFYVILLISLTRDNSPTKEATTA